MKIKGFFRTFSAIYTKFLRKLYSNLYMPMTHKQHFKCLNFKHLKAPDSV